MAKIALCLEDDPKMPISRALNMSFNGSSVYFSEGNERLASCMHTQLKKGYDLVIGFMDLPPDNISVKKEFKNAIKYFKRYNILDSVLLVPVVCTEYFVLNALDSIKALDLGINVEPIWERIKAGEKHGVPSKSLERVCKDILGGPSKECQRNTSKGLLGGKFYTSSCGDCYKHCYPMSLIYKCELLYTELPCFDVVSDEHSQLLTSLGFKAHMRTREEIMNKVSSFMKSLYELYGYECYFII